MSGSELLLDTNILIYALQGMPAVRPFFEAMPYISFVSEIEVLGVKGMKQEEISLRETAVEYCRIIPITNKIIKRVIQLKRDLKIHVPDAIISATALEEGFKLATADRGFRRI